MKKIISICLLVVLISTNFSFVHGVAIKQNALSKDLGSTTNTTNQGECPGSPGCPGYQQTMDANCTTQQTKVNSNKQIYDNCVLDIQDCLMNAQTPTEANCGDCTQKKTQLSTSETELKTCQSNIKGKSGTTDTTTTDPTDSTSVMGITCGPNELVNGQCKLNIYNTLGIRKSVGGDTSVGLFVQDVVLSATFFIGTLVTIALVVSGLMYIFAASSGKSPDKAKQGVVGSLLGLLIVVSSYVIIRLVQYIAKGF